MIILKNQIIKLKKKFYDEKKDIIENEKLLKKINFSKNIIIKNLAKKNLDYYSKDLSWHYHIFSGFNKNKKYKILEIGTFVGNFTNFLSKTFGTSKIYTIDLEDNHRNFVYTYDKKKIKNKKDFFITRKKNLSNKNIVSLKINSLDLINKFKKNYFDIIWVDGDHLDPQVSIDIFSSLHLLKKGGIFCCDDICLNKNDPVINQTDGHKILKYLELNNKIKTYFFVKRINKNNDWSKKYISLSFKR